MLKVTYRMDEELLNFLSSTANDQGITRNALVVRILNEYKNISVGQNGIAVGHGVKTDTEPTQYKEKPAKPFFIGQLIKTESTRMHAMLSSQARLQDNSQPRQTHYISLVYDIHYVETRHNPYKAATYKVLGVGLDTDKLKKIQEQTGSFMVENGGKYFLATDTITEVIEVLSKPKASATLPAWVSKEAKLTEYDLECKLNDPDDADETEESYTIKVDEYEAVQAKHSEASELRFLGGAVYVPPQHETDLMKSLFGIEFSQFPTFISSFDYQRWCDEVCDLNPNIG